MDRVLGADGYWAQAGYSPMALRKFSISTSVFLIDHLQGKTANFLRGMMEAMTMAENNRIVYLVKLSFKGKDEMKLR